MRICCISSPSSSSASLANRLHPPMNIVSIVSLINKKLLYDTLGTRTHKSLGTGLSSALLQSQTSMGMYGKFRQLSEIFDGFW